MTAASGNDRLAALRAVGPDRAVGWIGLDTPLELIDAANFVPVQVTADPGAPSPAAEPFGEGVGHPLLRALVGAVIALSEAGLKRLWISATPAYGFSLYTCLIGLQRSRSAAAGLRIDLVDLLHGDSVADATHNLALFHRLAADLGDGGGARADRLGAAIADRNRLRTRLRALEALRRDRLWSGTRAVAIHTRCAGISTSDALARLDIELGDLDAARPIPGRPVVVSGPAETAARTYPVYEVEGLVVVGDDHDGGSRAIGPLVAEDVDPIRALAERYRARTPAPGGWSTAASTAALLETVQRQGAEAVVFDIPLYDHPAAWDFPAKRAALEAAGIGWTLLEPDAFRAPEAAARRAAEALTLQPASERAR